MNKDESQNNNENCGTRKFKEEEEGIVGLTQDMFSIAYRIYWFGVNLVKDVINLLIDDATNAVGDKKKYALAQLLLLNRSIQHIESMRLLTESGFYGNSFLVLRSLMSDLAMLQYLHFHPELLDLFLNEKKDDYQENNDFKKAFSEGAVEKDLVERGIKPFSSTFQVLSKVSHSSSFGSQLYGSRGEKGGQYHFNYGPKYEPEKSLMLLDIIVSAYYDLADNILWHRYNAKEEINSGAWNKVKEDVGELRSKINIHTEATKDTLKIMWPELSGNNN
jgi:hypothetical protein